MTVLNNPRHSSGKQPNATLSEREGFEAADPPFSADAWLIAPYGLAELGIRNVGRVYYNLPVPKLVEHALAREEGRLAENGALVVETGRYTGRSPDDKFIVDEPSSRNLIDWNQFNAPISEENFHRLYQRVFSYVQGRDLYIFDGYVGADPNYRFGVRVINELASQNLFAHQLFLRPTAAELKKHQADFTVIAAPGFTGRSGGRRHPQRSLYHPASGQKISADRRLSLCGGNQKIRLLADELLHDKARSIADAWRRQS